MKKGFTLIELLAVIIILAVIALIATPIVLDVVESSKESVAKSEAAMVLDSAKLYYAEQYIKQNGFEGYECNISNKIGCDELSLEGEKPDSAIIIISKDGRVKGKVVSDGYTHYICDNNISLEDTCSVVDYANIYSITIDGVITGFKTNSITAFLNIIPVVNADELTVEAQNYLEGKKITIPEYVGDIEVIGISSNAFNSYDIDTITILPTTRLNIGDNAFPQGAKIKIKSCVQDYYYEYVDVLQLISSSCTVENYKDPILNGADPELDEGMIPVIIASDGSLTKASLLNEWYSYGDGDHDGINDKRWANIVLVKEEVRDTYQNAMAGTTIETDDVLAYYVWVPRYRYEIFTDVNNLKTGQNFNTNTAQQINVVFEDKYQPKSTGTTKDSWLTHPAFTFGSEELNGIWVGKFETTGTSDEPTILPNVDGLRKQNVSTQFVTSLKFANNILNSDGSISHLNNETYGINNTDAHMMKNSEWGAVAYLTNSIYGRCTNGICEEVRINNSSIGITGCAAATAATTKTYNEYLEQTNHSEGSFAGCENEYNTTIGVLASTTGNITGIYDMSGGSWEYVMGILEDSLNSGIPLSGRNDLKHSGFTGKLGCPTCDTSSGNNSNIKQVVGLPLPDSKYYDIYTYGNTNTDKDAYLRGQLGDATLELGSFASNVSTGDNKTRYHSTWNKDSAHFVYERYPFFIRGCSWFRGIDSGIFSFGNEAGMAGANTSFRSVLAK